MNAISLVGEKVRQFLNLMANRIRTKKLKLESISESRMTQNKDDDIYKDGTIMHFPTNPSPTSE
ncbi:MAG: hypothetical protein ACJ709_04530 [Nitrososphaeraceae archaeon]